MDLGFTSIQRWEPAVISAPNRFLCKKPLFEEIKPGQGDQGSRPWEGKNRTLLDVEGGIRTGGHFTGTYPPPGHAPLDQGLSPGQIPIGLVGIIAEQTSGPEWADVAWIPSLIPIFSSS